MRATAQSRACTRMSWLSLRRASAVGRPSWVDVGEATSGSTADHCYGSPPCGTSTVVVSRTASRAVLRLCSAKSGAAHMSRVRPSHARVSRSRRAEPRSRPATEPFSPAFLRRASGWEDRTAHEEICFGFRLIAASQQDAGPPDRSSGPSGPETYPGAGTAAAISRSVCVNSSKRLT
jgi:hypothetical protein